MRQGILYLYIMFPVPKDKIKNEHISMSMGALKQNILDYKCFTSDYNKEKRKS